VTCAKTGVGRILGKPGLGRKTRHKGRVRRLNGGDAIPGGSGGLPAWQAAVARPVGRVRKRAIMQPGKGKVRCPEMMTF